MLPIRRSIFHNRKAKAEDAAPAPQPRTDPPGISPPSSSATAAASSSTAPPTISSGVSVTSPTTVAADLGEGGTQGSNGGTTGSGGVVSRRKKAARGGGGVPPGPHGGGAVNPYASNPYKRMAKYNQTHHHHHHGQFGNDNPVLDQLCNSPTIPKLIFGALWVLTLRSWYNNGIPFLTSTPAQSTVKTNTGVISYSLYDGTYSTGGGGGWDTPHDDFGGGGPGGNYGFGSEMTSRYLDGALANAKLLPEIYPNWKMRIYHDDSLKSYPTELSQLRNFPHVELVNVQHSQMRGLAKLTNKMMWRFAVASDPHVGRYCVRDIDSRLSHREAEAVKEWVRSGRKFHVMRDHPSHVQHVMSGGMWCGTHDGVPNLVDLMLRDQDERSTSTDSGGYDYGGGDRGPDYLKDMDFLSAHVWPVAQRSVLQHDAFSCQNYRRARGFPTQRIGGEHVGSVFVSGRVRQEDVDILTNALREGRQPRQCRDRNVAESRGAPDLGDERSSGGGDWGGGGGDYNSHSNLRNDPWQGDHSGDWSGDWDNEGGGGGDRHQRQQEEAATPPQDPNKPITNIGGRTCFKHAKLDDTTTKPDRAEGQVTSETSFGQALRKVASQPDVKRILESGTWYGGGSTNELAEAIKPKSNCVSNVTHHCCESFVVTMELYQPAWEHARLYHADNPVWLVRGSTVGVEQMLKESELTEADKDEHYQLYYKRDRDLMAESTPKLEKFCNFLRPDLVLIDGNEYTGWGEFKVVMNKCRPRYIALHDTGTLKTRGAEAFITKKKPELFEVVESGRDAAGWSIYKFKQPDPMIVNGFRIIVLTQKRHDSLKRLLDSINGAEYGDIRVELEIRVDYDESDDHEKTVKLVNQFKFNHGEKHVHLYTRTEGLQMAWLNAWKPSHDDERAVIIEDDLELSPLWFTWLRRAWAEYGNRPDLGGISLCRQRLRASDGMEIMVERDEPFLYRVPGSFGFSPNARYWRDFMGWVRTNDVREAKMDVPGTVTTDWYRTAPDFWEQAWIWWCWSAGRSLYTLYVHSRRGALIGHWAEPGVHSETSPGQRNDDLLTLSEPVIESFPVELVKFGWNFEVESGVGEVVHRQEEDRDASGDDLVTNPDPQDGSDKAGKAHVVWMNDFHISTVAYVKKLLEPKGVKFIDKSLSGHCHQTNTCATDLKVLTQENSLTPDEYTRSSFVKAYKDDREMAQVEIVMCFHPSSMCELFMPLKKRLFVIATTRYEMGRESASEWKSWNKNLKAIAADPKNLVAANNLYDAKYIEYFTGLKPVLIPSWFKMDDSDMYTGISDDILVAPMHSSGAEKILKKLKTISPRFVDLRAKYEHYEFSQLSENTAIIHFPYQVSVMSLFEQYAMGIPILVPAPGFLWELHDKLDLMNERTWQQVRSGVKASASPIPGKEGVPDPNNDVSRDAFLHWVQYADFYQWPHIVQFTSWKDLRRKLEESDWEVVSDEMLGYVKTAIEKTSDEWTSILEHHESRSSEGWSSPLAAYLSEWTKTLW